MSLQDAQTQLGNYGVSEIAPAQGPPGGWNIVVEPIGLAPDAYYGRFNLGGEPQVITFVTPPLWVVSKPNIDYNGAAGTVQANDYGKGDSATLWVNTEFSGDMSTFTKKEFMAELRKGLTTKGKQFVEALKIGKIRDGAPGYKIVDYSYELQTAAGFSIARWGIASFAAIGTNKLQIFWTGVVGTRKKTMQEDLTRMVESFRIATLPKSISSSIKEFKNMDQAMSKDDLPKAPFS